MRLSLLAPLGLAAFLGMVAADAPDANALARRTVVTTPRGTTVITRRPRVASTGRLRGARGQITVSRPGLRCRTIIVNGTRVRRCR